MTKTLAVFLCVFLSLAANELPRDYFPLAVGNHWVYQSSAGSPRVVDINGVENINGQTYFVVSGLNGRELLRREESGAIRVLDPESGQERWWIDFSAPVQVDRESAAHPCSTTAAIVSRSYRGRFNLGEFEQVTQVRFGGNVCADAGLSADYFLPGIGLLRREEQSLAGPRRYELVYARINGVVMVTGSERSFLLATDAIQYPYQESRPFRARVRFTLRSQSLLPTELTFPSTQEYDLVIRDARGSEVYRWSSTRTFAAVIQKLTIAGEKNWAEEITLADATGKALPPGDYSLDVVITSTGAPQYRAQVPIQIVRPAE